MAHDGPHVTDDLDDLTAAPTAAVRHCDGDGADPDGPSDGGANERRRGRPRDSCADVRRQIKFAEGARTGLQPRGDGVLELVPEAGELLGLQGGQAAAGGAEVVQLLGVGPEVVQLPLLVRCPVGKSEGGEV